MKNTNIGIVNLIVSNKLKNSYFNNNLINESKELSLSFFDIVKNSPILQLEFKVYNNIENKHIGNDSIASRYIDDNIKLFESYTIDEIDNEHNKLNTLIINETIPNNKYKITLYNAINTLIIESLKVSTEINVDDIYESFDIVLNHIKTPKTTINESVVSDTNNKNINDDVIKIAINKFNEKYETLNEEDRNLIQRLINSNEKEKQNLLEIYKHDNLDLLYNHNEASTSELNEYIKKTIEKINEIKYNPQTVIDDIITLHELKMGII